MSEESEASANQNPNRGSSKVYTRTGDKGKTSLIGGTRVSKAHLRLETYGTVDELNSVIGVVIAELDPDLTEHSSLIVFLQRTQADLFEIGSQLACEDKSLRERLPIVHEDHIAELEVKMDEFSANLPELKNFILPGGSRASAQAHMARTICRRAERLCVAMNDATSSTGIETPPAELVIVRYLNRLSDFMFVLARHLNRLSGSPEILWSPRSDKKTSV